MAGAVTLLGKKKAHLRANRGCANGFLLDCYLRSERSRWKLGRDHECAHCETTFVKNLRMEADTSVGGRLSWVEIIESGVFWDSSGKGFVC
jgi:hypothetical protein